MNRKILRKLLSGILLCSPLFIHAWDELVDFEEGEGCISFALNKQVNRKSATIFVQAQSKTDELGPNFSVKWEKFRLYRPQKDEKGYDDKYSKYTFYIPDVPMFVVRPNNST